MKRHNLFSSVSLWVGILVLGGLSLEASPAAAVSGYRVRYKACSIEMGLNRRIRVKDAVYQKSYVKIQHVNKIPQEIVFYDGISVNAPTGTLYLTEPLTVPLLSVESGYLERLYTEARILHLACPNRIGDVTCNKTWIDYLELGVSLRSLRVSAQANSSLSEYATVRVSGIGMYPGEAASVQVSGAIVEDFVLRNTAVTFLKVASKKCRTSLPLQNRNFVSVGGIGRLSITDLPVSGDYRIEADSVGKIQAAGANILPDSVLSLGAISSIRSVSARLNGVRRGGWVGLLVGAMIPATEFNAPSFGTIHGDAAVCGTFWAGPQGYPDIPFHQGTIKKITTHPTKGSLVGTAHVMPTNRILFVPKNHPLFAVCDDPGNHSAP